MKYKSIEEAVNKVNGKHKEKILQFGEGNFLRAFADWMVDKANSDGFFNGSIVLCQPIKDGLADLINSQDGLYTVVMKGIENGKQVERYEAVTSVSRCINPYTELEELMKLAESKDLEIVISNTTESGIVVDDSDLYQNFPNVAFPGKVCAFLYRRFKSMGETSAPGLLFLPVELIDNNGIALKNCVLKYIQMWDLGTEFKEWVINNNEFANTLVDRIVTGFPKNSLTEYTEKLSYEDNLITVCEPFNLWVIECDKKWEAIFPVNRTAANVVFTNDASPYKKRKVRVLNGSHTAVVPLAFLAGYDKVSDFFEKTVFGNFERDLIFDEIIPATDMDKNELISFAEDVIERFKNPYIQHFLLDMTLNSCSKFAVRCLPTILDYVEKYNKVPVLFAFCFAGFLRFFRITKQESGVYTGVRDNGSLYEVRDDTSVLDFFSELWKEEDLGDVVRKAFSNTQFWMGKDLCEVPGLESKVSEFLDIICKHGAEQALLSVFKKYY